MSTGAELFEPRRFAAAIERVATRRSPSPAATSLAADGVSLITVWEERHAFGRALARDLAAGRLPASPGRLRYIQKGGKRRRLFDLPLVELIIHDAVAAWLAETTGHRLSPHLYSYQPGISYRSALGAFARYVRVAQGTCTGSAGGGLYVVRRDIRAYFDSIPVDDGAPLWSVLRESIGGAAVAAPVWAAVRRAVRPAVLDGDAVRVLDRGIPTGSPIANVVANLYLGAMDEELSSVPGAFYARYGDDVVAAHPDGAVAATLARMLAAHLGPMGLEFGSGKSQDLLLCARGGPRASAAEPRPVHAVELLGHRVSAAGATSLSATKTRALLIDLRRRAANAVRHGDADADSRIAAAATAANRLLDPASPTAHPYARLLRTTVTDRTYLGWLDHEMALTILGAALGRRSPQHFRRYPPRLLRSRFRLRSVVAARNRRGRPS